MPELDGFGRRSRGRRLRDAGGGVREPRTTSSAEAFEGHAFDYMLKPVDRERSIDAAAARSHRTRRNRASLGDRLEALPRRAGRTPSGTATPPIRQDGGSSSSAGGHEWLEADGNNVRVHIGKESHLIRETLSKLESRLPARSFMRIHRRLGEHRAHASPAMVSGRLRAAARRRAEAHLGEKLQGTSEVAVRAGVGRVRPADG